MPAPTKPLGVQTSSHHLSEVFLLFLKLGITAFGGPAAHIGLFHDEVVKRRKWLDEQAFLDLLGAVNLIPGPNSTEMAIHVSFLRAGWAGLILGGSAFILPAMAIVMALAWAYVRYGSTPQVGWLLYGIKPVVIAIIFQALWSLSQKAIKGWLTAVAGLVALSLYFAGIQPVAALLVGGLLVVTGSAYPITRKLDIHGLILLSSNLGVFIQVSAPFSLFSLFLIFVKIGAVLYGSGYVLLAFLRADLVSRLGWLTDQQLLDAIAIGQVTPGPVFTTATFIGYVLAGIPGGVLATLGIFLPSFIFVAFSSRIIPRLRNWPLTASILDGVNVASLGLMAAVTWELGRSSLIDPLTICLSLITALLLIRYKVNSTWLIFGGAIVGLIAAFLS